MKKIKIVHFQLIPMLSGVQNMMLHILESLPREEFDIFVISQPQGPLVEAVKAKGYEHIPLKFLHHEIHIMDIVVFFQLIWLFRKQRFDIVHTHSSKPGLLGRIAATIARVPNIIHTSHGSPFYLGQKHITFLLYRELERLACLFGNKIVFVNNDHRKYYIQHRLVAAHKASTIYNALIPELQKSLESCVRNPENQQEAITIGSILRFSQQKNIIQTLEVCIRICLARNDVNFCFVGDGEHYPLCQQMVQTHHLQERIQLPGWSNQSVMWLQSFDIFMLYSLYEGLPISIIEAMHAGLPILASDIMGNSELVTTCNGWLVSPDNPVELEKTLHIAINSRTSLVRLGQTSRLLVIQRCSYSDFINGYLSLYKERN